MKVPNIKGIDCITVLNNRFEFLFEGDLINEICATGQLKSFPPDTTIIDFKDELSHIPLVLDGSIKVMTEDDEGDELLLYYLESGDTCAVTLNCCTKQSKSSVRAITETDVNIVFIPSEKMEAWMVKFKSWRDFIIESYNSRFNEMLGSIDTLVFQSMEERLIKYLRDKAWVQKSASLIVSHREIANDLHSSRVVISRLMKKLENNGLIKQYRNKIDYLEFAN